MKLSLLRQYENKKLEYLKVTYSILLLILYPFLIQLSFGYQGKFIYIISFATFLLFLVNKCRIFYKFVILFLSSVAVIYSPIGLLYNFPDVNSVGSLMYTNPNESIEFVTNLPFWVYLYQLLLIIVSILVFKVTLAIKSKICYLCLIFFIIVAFSSAIKNFVKYGYDPKELLLLRQPEIRFFIDGVESCIKVNNENNKYLNVINLKHAWNPEIINEEYDTYILVIGESVRKDFMPHWGYPKNNTPWMNKQSGIYFNDYVSAGPSTVISLTHSLVLLKDSAPDLIHNVVTLANSAGFESWWISNQGAKGAFDSPVAIIGKMADHYTFIKDSNSNDRDFIPDDLLLPYIENALDLDANKKKFIVAHIIGSHPQPCARTNNQYDELIDDKKETSCYVTSIRQTDDFLKNVTELANQKQTKWTMLYFSDHGLKLINKGFSNETLTHGHNYKQSYQVPFFVTSYDADKVVNINAKRSGLHLLPMLGRWMGVKDDLITEQCDWFSQKECIKSIKVFDSTAQKINYDDLLDDAIE